MLELIRPRKVISATRSDVPNRPRSTTSSRKRASGSWSAIPVTPRLKAATVKTKLTNKLAQRATNRNRVKQPNLRSAMARHQAGGEQWGAQVDSEANPGRRASWFPEGLKPLLPREKHSYAPGKRCSWTTGVEGAKYSGG